MPLTLVAFSSRSAPISIARSEAAVSVVKNGLPVPAAKMTQRPFLEVPHGAAADVVLADFLDADGGHDARVAAERFERVLQREAVHDGREHAHVVGGDAVHAGPREARAAEDVAAADDDGDLDVAGHDVPDLAGDALQDGRVDAVVGGAEQRLAADLEQDPLERLPGLRIRHCRLPSAGLDYKVSSACRADPCPSRPRPGP